MRNLFLFVAISLTVVVNAQVELKGVELSSTNPDYKEGVTTTLIGNEYVILTRHLNDERIYLIAAIPAEGDNIRHVHYTELKQLKSALEKKYEIKFKFLAKESYDEYSGWYRASKDGVSYMITTDHNKYRDQPYKISLFITNDELDKINTKEEQEKANDDL